MKRVFTVLLAAALLFPCACAPRGENNKETPDGKDGEDEVKLTLWTYPVGNWSNAETVSLMLSAFHHEYPNIRVSMKALDYETGDDVIETAIEEKELPDLVLEGPERLVANWGARGKMAEISDLWKEEGAAGIYQTVKEACHDGEGRYYVYPVCMTTHCMAINADLFKKAGAWQYIDETTHTWTTENFIKAVETLAAYQGEDAVEEVAAVFCGGQGGDQGTRALVNNLYGGTFTDPQHKIYTADSEANIRALELLKSLKGIRFDPSLNGTTEIEKFCDGELAMAFCWNVFMEVKQIVNNPNLDFDIFPMAFPTDQKQPALQGGIWGFGIFDNGNAKKIEAAKKFIRFITGNEEVYSRAVLTSTYWPVREMPDLYVNDELMNEYSIFSRYLGDFYQVTPHWATARTAWWNMLQRIGAGEEVAKAVAEFSAQANSENQS